MKWIYAALAFVLAGPASAVCSGNDIRPTLASDDRARIEARVAEMPFAQGNHWRATRGDKRIHLIGTIHLDDPQLDPITERLKGVIEAADVALFEMTDAENQQLEAAMSTQPDLLFMQDTTLAEALPDADWQRVMEAMRARGIPPVVGSRFQPWYMTVLLAMPPCLSAELQASVSGLDHRLMQIADDTGVPVQALEPWDMLFSLFSDDPLDAQIKHLMIGLQTAEDGDDMLATLKAGYFEEKHGQAWEISRWKALATEGLSRSEAAALFADMEYDLLTQRNRAWIPVLMEASAAHDRVVAAFGAAHLSGTEGVLALLEAEGFTLERLPF